MRYENFERHDIASASLLATAGPLLYYFRRQRHFGGEPCARHALGLFRTRAPAGWRNADDAAIICRTAIREAPAVGHATIATHTPRRGGALDDEMRDGRATTR